MRAVGEGARLYYDGPRVREGDYLRTATTGRLYLVLGVRVQQSGKHRGRQHLRTVVVGSDHPIEPDARVLPIRWYARGRR